MKDSLQNKVGEMWSETEKQQQSLYNLLDEKKNEIETHF